MGKRLFTTVFFLLLLLLKAGAASGERLHLVQDATRFAEPRCRIYKLVFINHVFSACHQREPKGGWVFYGFQGVEAGDTLLIYVEQNLYHKLRGAPETMLRPLKIKLKDNRARVLINTWPGKYKYLEITFFEEGHYLRIKELPIPEHLSGGEGLLP